MPCDHAGPAEIIAMAEEELRAKGETPADGMRFRWAENHDGYFASAVTEIERRREEWVVVRLDRNRERLPDGEVGLRRVV
jgi:hypothetical protein